MGNGRALKEMSVEFLDFGSGTNASRTTKVLDILSKSAYASGSERRWSARV